jgi:acyl-CoA synthetase (NDP forming)
MFASANEGSIRALSGLLTQWGRKKPIVCCFSSPPGIWEEEVASLVEEGSITNYATPEEAAKSLSALWKYKKIRETRKGNSRKPLVTFPRKERE